MLSLGLSQEHTGVLDTTLHRNQINNDFTTLQGNHINNGLDMNLPENQENNGLATSLEGNQEISGTSNHRSTSAIKSRIIGQKRVCCSLDREIGSVSSPSFTITVKNESMDENCNGYPDNFNNARSLSFSHEHATPLTLPLCCNENGLSRTCSSTEPRIAVGSSGICASAVDLFTLEKDSYVSRTFSATPSRKLGALNGNFADVILCTTKNLSSTRSNFTRNANTQAFEPAIETSEENSSESTFTRKATTELLVPTTETSGKTSSEPSTSIIKAKTEPFETSTETSEENIPESTHFIQKAKSFPFGPAVEASVHGENSVSHLNMLRAEIKAEEINEDPLDVMDHISLKDRLNMLLVRPACSFQRCTAENLNTSKLPTSIAEVKTELFEPTIETYKNKTQNFTELPSFIRKIKTEPFESAIETSDNRENNVCHLNLVSSDIRLEEINENPVDVIDHISLKDRFYMLLARQASSFHQYTAENSNTSKLPTSITEAKAEPFEPTIDASERKNNISKFELPMDDVKAEKINESLLDVIDHISLKDRLNMLWIRQGYFFKQPRMSRDSKTNDPNTTSRATMGTTKCARQRKRKRTATDSVEKALGEDAPELLQVLVDQGINMEEIKLYEVMDDDDELIDVIEDDFTDLGHVMSKLFFERSNSLLKLNSCRDMKDAKASYSFSCLVSLIQQAQYLLLRKCPVEWGWCRDLQSFIFVFEMHNRIVLERPEYGYATYFFELVESFPINWQVKRLIIAMKLTGCSRLAIVENKSLMVGRDLTEGEAGVLQDYGWKSGTGLASMLNFCDRVTHDRRTEMSLSEWKSKIGKLLMDGYDGGRIVVQSLPRKVLQYLEKQSSLFGTDEKSLLNF